MSGHPPTWFAPDYDEGDFDKPLCDDCNKRVEKLHDASQDQFDADLCPSCFDNRCEAAYDRQQEDLMSEPGPSLDEQHRAAWDLHERTHRR